MKILDCHVAPSALLAMTTLRIGIFFLTFIFLILPIQLQAFSSSSTSPSIIPILDANNDSALTKHFRTTANLPGQNNINWHGFKDLNLVGSAQFSELSLFTSLSYLPSPCLIVDLRQESHGYLNGHAISFYPYDNNVNAEKARLNSFAEKENVIIYQVIKKDNQGRIIESKPLQFKVLNVYSEKELVEGMSMQNYFRIAVEDEHAPDDAAVDRFITLIRNKPKKMWLYFHCRAGKGRTTMFMVMTDMLKNAKAVSFEDILAREVAIGGKDLAKLPSPDSYKYEPAKKRLAFLHRFYQYAHENQDNKFKIMWSEWKTK